MEIPTLIKALQGKHVVHISCGTSYSAAVTASGELYTWGRGNYGRLGHGNTDDQTLPKQVVGLKGEKVMDVACGSGDAQTLAVTESGKYHRDRLCKCALVLLLFLLCAMMNNYRIKFFSFVHICLQLK